MAITLQKAETMVKSCELLSTLTLNNPLYVNTNSSQTLCLHTSLSCHLSKRDRPSSFAVQISSLDDTA
eukprot:c24266_g9_i2 orf=81-284(+)